MQSLRHGTPLASLWCLTLTGPLTLMPGPSSTRTELGARVMEPEVILSCGQRHTCRVHMLWMSFRLWPTVWVMMQLLGSIATRSAIAYNYFRQVYALTVP
jgi:hypothetical protein